MAKAKYGNTVKIHYTASLGDGTVLSTTLGGKPLQFSIGADQVIQDFEDAVIGMNEGEAKKTAIPRRKDVRPVPHEQPDRNGPQSIAGLFVENRASHKNTRATFFSKGGRCFQIKGNIGY